MKVLLLVGALALAGCASAPPNIIARCELPAELDAHDSVSDLDASSPIPQERALELWAQDRGHLAKSVKHGNDTVDWVRDHCQ